MQETNSKAFVLVSVKDEENMICYSVFSMVGNWACF